MVAYFFINTDRKTVGEDDSVERWFSDGFAATGGDRKYGRMLARMAPGDVCLMYRSKIGVVGVGDVLERPTGEPVDEPIHYAGRLKEGEWEYRVAVHWWADRRKRPITAQALEVRGIRVTPNAVRRVSEGAESAEALVRDLRAAQATAPREARQTWTKESFFAEVRVQAPAALEGLRMLHDQAEEANGLSVFWGAGDTWPRFIVRRAGTASGDLLSGWANGNIGIHIATLMDLLGERNPVLDRLVAESRARGWFRQKESVFEAEQLQDPRVAHVVADLLREIAAPRESGDAAPLNPLSIGAPYRPADESSESMLSAPVEVDPDKVDRGCRAHSETQNALASFLRERHIEPRSPGIEGPPFDIAWCHDGVAYIAEVKSVTDANEEKQLRLGLGQVLRYRSQSNARQRVVGVLVAEREPRDTSWANTCAEVNVVLTWPQVFGRLLRAPT